MTLLINGEHRVLPDGVTVEELLREIGRDPATPGVAVAVGHRVVRRAEWAETPVHDGDQVEVVTAAQGG